MKIGIVLTGTDHEKTWNALRFANTAILEGHQVRIFLLGQGVEIESIESTKFNVKEPARKVQSTKWNNACLRNLHKVTSNAVWNMSN